MTQLKIRRWISRTGLTVLMSGLAFAQQDIVFELAAGGGNTDIYSISPLGSAPLNLTNHPAMDRQAKISPDGRSMVFASNRDGNYELYVMQLPGGEARRMTHTLYDEGDPSWSPNGKQIVCDVDDGGLPRIELVNLPSGETRFLTADWQRGFRPDWSPTGGRIVLEIQNGGNRQLAILSPDGGQPGLLNLLGSHPSWSRDGTKILFTHPQGGLFVADAGGVDQKRLIPDGDEAAWSPDGQSIVYVVANGGSTQLFTAAADGSNRLPLRGGPSGVHRPDW